jgi:uncharacterized membrane protein YdbT with pleckstrin-like domain
MNNTIFHGKSNRALHLISAVWNIFCFIIAAAISMAFLTMAVSGLVGTFCCNGKLHQPTLIAGILLYILLVAIKITYTIYLRKAQSYHITDREITTSGGILRKYHKTIRLAEIRSLSYQRTLIQQIFGCGDIFINSSATHNATIRLKNIDNVHSIYHAINHHR